MLNNEEATAPSAMKTRLEEYRQRRSAASQQGGSGRGSGVTRPTASSKGKSVGQKVGHVLWQVRFGLFCMPPPYRANDALRCWWRCLLQDDPSRAADVPRRRTRAAAGPAAREAVPAKKPEDTTGLGPIGPTRGLESVPVRTVLASSARTKAAGGARVKGSGATGSRRRPTAKQARAQEAPGKEDMGELEALINKHNSAVLKGKTVFEPTRHSVKDYRQVRNCYKSAPGTLAHGFIYTSGLLTVSEFPAVAPMLPLLSRAVGGCHGTQVPLSLRGAAH